MRCLLLFLCLVQLAVCQRTKRLYFMDNEFVLIKLEHHQFSIYAEERSNLVYKIESKNYSQANMLAYPSKQIVGKLQHQKVGKVIEVVVEVFDNQTQRWQKGKMSYTPLASGKDRVDLEWNGRSFKYIHHLEEVPGAFFTPPDTVLAELQYLSHKRRTDYEVEIYSDEIPDPVYLLFIAALTEIIKPYGKKKMFN